jgi:hypothetical protein
MRKEPAETAPAAPPEAPRPKGPAASGLSQFLGRVFEQLSLSSWFPAAMLIGNGAVLLQLHADENLGLAAAIKRLTEKPLGVIIVLLFALILATIVIQAFEYEMIRLLEGYVDRTRGPLPFLVRIRIRRHARKLDRLEQRLQQARRSAFLTARAVMLTRHYDRTHLDILENDVFDREQGPVKRKLAEEALSIDWTAHLPSEIQYRMDALDARVAAYPHPSRLLPTRLGNALRAAEDRLPVDAGEKLVGFVSRHHDRLPPALRDEHRDYRTRLDMYCSLVLVFLMLAAGSVVALRPVATPLAVTATAMTYAAMSWVSYEAAIASARGYGDALEEIGAFVAAEQQESDGQRRSVAGRLRTLLHRDAV